MIDTTILGLLAVLFAYFSKYRKAQYGLAASFILIFIFLALRYDFGNDYNGYFQGFLEINRIAKIDYFNNNFRYEPGWILLCQLFKHLGFFAMVAVLALLNCIIYYRFIKKYVAVKYYWLAVFIYIFSPGFMLVQASAMRQSFAIAIFLFSIDYIYKKQPLQYFFCIGVAWFFHSSASVLLPLYLLGYINWKINRASIIIFISIFLSLFVFVQQVGSLINQLVDQYYIQYDIYEGATAIGSGLGVVYALIMLIVILYYDRFQLKETALLFKIAILGFMFIPLGLSIQLIGRVSMYFAPATIIVYPILQRSIKDPRYKSIFIVSLIFMTLFTYVAFFQSETYKDGFGIYKTIFSAPSQYY